MSTLTQHSMIRAAEVWAAEEEGDELRLTSAWKLGSDQVHAATVIERICQSGGPAILNQRGNQLVDAPLSLSAETGSAVFGLPIIAEGRIRAGLVVHLECLDNSLGALEIWSRDKRDELLVNGAVYANLGRFANISRYVRFPRASGLPGKSWEARNATLINRLESSPGFMRAAGARAGGLEIGVGLPVMSTEFDLHSVVLFLSSSRSPIARVFEIWEMDDAAERIVRRARGGDCCPRLEQGSDHLPLEPNEGLVGHVWSTGIPYVTDDVAALDTHRAPQLAAAGLTRAIAVPVWVGAKVRSVFVMLS